MTTVPTASEVTTPNPGKRPFRIPFSSLGAGALLLIAGAVAVLVIQNTLGRETITFSTTGLISFLFGIALAAASTVLAVAAILLGKASEQAMIERSDASIRLQNEVFVKTTDALARIESSTGVTEKRIEDIISGRAGELSRVIAEKITPEGTSRSRNRDSLEQEIKESLIGELSASRALRLRQEEESFKLKAEGNTKYRQFQSTILAQLANSGVARCEKIGDGSFGAAGEGLYDGIFLCGADRVAVSSFSTHPGVAPGHVKNFEDFLLASARELEAGTFSRVVIALDGLMQPDDRYRRILAKVTAVLKQSLAERIMLFDGADGSAASRIVEYVRSLQTPAGSLKLAST